MFVTLQHWLAEGTECLLEECSFCILRVVSRHPLLFSATLRKFPPHYAPFTETQRDTINERVNVMAYEAIESGNGETFTAAIIPLPAKKVLPKQKDLPSSSFMPQDFPIWLYIIVITLACNVFSFRRQPHALSRHERRCGNDHVATFRLMCFFFALLYCVPYLLVWTRVANPFDVVCIIFSYVMVSGVARLSFVPETVQVLVPPVYTTAMQQ